MTAASGRVSVCTACSFQRPPHEILECEDCFPLKKPLAYTRLLKKKKKIVTRGNAVTSNMKSWRFPTDLAAFIRVPKKSDAVLRVSCINEIRNKCLKDRHPPVKPVLPQRAPLCRVAFFTNTLFSLPLTLSNS